MGLDPDEEGIVTVLNPEFNWEEDWTYGLEWSRIPNYARMRTRGMGASFLEQANIETTIGTTYYVGFNIIYRNMGVLGFGLIVDLSGDTDGLKYINIGKHVAKIVSTQNGSTLRFHHDWVNPGLETHIDSISISTQLNFVVNNLGFNWPDIRRTEFFTRAGNRKDQILASRNGKTNCLIGFHL